MEGKRAAIASVSLRAPEHMTSRTELPAELTLLQLERARNVARAVRAKACGLRRFVKCAGGSLAKLCCKWRTLARNPEAGGLEESLSSDSRGRVVDKLGQRD